MRVTLGMVAMMFDMLFATIMSMMGATWMAVMMRRATTKANAVTCDT